MDYAFPIVIGLFLFAVLLRIAYKVMKYTPPSYGTDDGQTDVQSNIKSARDNTTFEKIRREERTRTFGKHAVLAAPYGKGLTKKPTISLTPRMIERVNTQRKLRGMQPLNRTGIKSAIAHPWDRHDVQQPQSSNDWLTYLILYECFISDHQSHTVGGVGGFTIDPNVPYNGQGGEYGGAGASGDWTSAPASVMSAVADVAPQTDADGIVNSYQNNPGYSFDTKSDPSPSYSAPDPSPSSSDRYSSSSSDSGLSSDSGSSGGSD